MAESEKVRYKGKGRLNVREAPGVPGTACLILREKINEEMKTRLRRCLGWGWGGKGGYKVGRGDPYSITPNLG